MSYIIAMDTHEGPEGYKANTEIELLVLRESCLGKIKDLGVFESLPSTVHHS